MAITVPATVTDPTKTVKPAIVPTVQPGTVQPVVASGIQPVAAAQQPAQPGMNAQVLQAGQQAALTGFQTPTLDLTSQKTRELLANPMLDYNPQQAVTAGMDTFNLGLSQQQEKLRRETATQYQSGDRLARLTDLAFRGTQEGAFTKAKLDADAATQTREALYKAIEQGRGTSESERQRFATNIGALTDVRGAAEGERSDIAKANESAIDRGMTLALANQNAELQTSLTALKGQIDSGMLMQQQDFAGVQASLDRAAAEALQKGDIAGQVQITALRGEIEKQALAAQQTWATGERIASQNYNTTERLSTQDYDTASKVIAQEYQVALQNNDYTNMQKLQDSKAQVDLQMQTQAFTQQGKMAYIEQQFAEATANNDVGRQKQIMQFQSIMQLDQMEAQYGYDQAMTMMQANIATALQNDEQSNAIAMMNAQHTFTAKQAVLDRQLEEARIAMTGRQIDMQGQQMTFDQIQQAVTAGQIDPQAAVDAVKASAAGYGIEIQAADPNAIYDDLDRDYRLSQYQFAQTHPEYMVKNPDGSFGGISDDGAKLFNDYLNTSYYGPDGKPVVGGSADIAGSGIALTPNATKGDGYFRMVTAEGMDLSPDETSSMLRNADKPTNQNYDLYQQYVASVPTLSLEISNNQTNEIGGIPTAFTGGIYNVGGRLVMITSINRDVGAGFGGGREHDEVTLKDLATGSSKTFSGLSGDDNTVSTVGGWASELASI